VKQQVEPKVDEAYQEGRRNIGANMPSVSEGKGSGTVYADYNSHGDSIDEMTKNAGIKNDVHQSVEHMVSKTSKLIRIGKIAYISRRMMFRMNTLVWKTTIIWKEINLRKNTMTKRLNREHFLERIQETNS
jgi:hypothetical protein